MRGLNNLIEQMDSLATDKKLEALEGLVLNLRTDNLSKKLYACVFCAFSTTANYLQSVLTEREIKTWLFTGGQTSEELNSALSGFRREQGILIATAVALTGIDLRDVQTLIHYDPTSESEVPFRISRNPTATHYLLKDTSGVLPVEWTVSNHLKTVPRK